MSGLDHLKQEHVVNDTGRSVWMRALMALPRESVKALIGELSQDLSVRLTTLPNSGLGLLKFKDSALKQSFYLGEFPLASASVELTLADGRRVLGAAQVMDDDADLATSLAIADAILAHGAPGNDELVNMVAMGEREHQREQTIRNAMLSRTKVNFSLLNMAQEEEGMEFDDE